MNKKLLIVRHAKSDWSTSSISDFNRPLNDRGKKNAPIMGIKLKKRDFVTDYIVSSPANRAISTAKLMVKELDLPIESIQLNSSIYDASCDTLLKIVNNIDQEKNVATLFGHNNGITDLAVYLTDADIFNIPTCGMVLITFPFDDWKMVSKNSGEVVFFDFPKNLEIV